EPRRSGTRPARARGLTPPRAGGYEPDVERIPELGRTLAHLRSLGGMSVSEAASRTGLTVAQLREAENGSVEHASTLARSWGLSARELIEGAMTGGDEAGD